MSYLILAMLFFFVAILAVLAGNGIMVQTGAIGAMLSLIAFEISEINKRK